MKHLFVALPVLLLSLQVSAQEKKPFTLNGNIAGLPDHKIYLSYADSTEHYKTDSVVSKGGKFHFTGKLVQPVEGRLYLSPKDEMYGKGDNTSFFMEAKAMQLTSKNGHLKDAKLTGSKVQADQEILDALRAPTMAKLKPLSDAFNTLNEAYIKDIRAKKSEEALAPLKYTLDSIKEKMEPFYDEMEKSDKVFIEKYPNSYVTAQLLHYRVGSMLLQEGEAYYAKMSPEMQASIDGVAIKKELDQLKEGSPGNPAFVFSKTDINGQTLNLADFKGKYVMLDFWASWCGPCRAGNPHLKELYTQYKSKGFEIIGVSDDDSDHNAWKKAVDKDGIGIWRHVLRGLDWDKRKKDLPNPEDLSDHFGIHTLPTKILIDPQGVIIGRYGGGGEDDDAMNKKLKELFGA